MPAPVLASPVVARLAPVVGSGSVVAVVVAAVGELVPSLALCEPPLVSAALGSAALGSSPEAAVVGAPPELSLATVDSSALPPALSKPQAVKASTVSGASQAVRGRIIATLFPRPMRMQPNSPQPA